MLSTFHRAPRPSSPDPLTPSTSPRAAPRAWRRLGAAFGLLALGLASGCASLHAVDNEVSSYGSWPAGRAPGHYVFDRLPSQVAHAERQAHLEAAAAAALAQAGFRPATEEAPADVTVQVGARIEVTEISPWADPFWWHGPYYGPAYIHAPYPLYPRPWWGPGPWVGPGPGPFWGPFPYEHEHRVERQVAVLIRDKATGLPLYETHAETTGSHAGSHGLIAAMFAGALAEFPKAQPEPHTVRTMLPRPGEAASAPAAAPPAPSPAASTPAHP